LIALLLAAATDPGATDTSWPPALVYFAIFLLVLALGAAYTIFRRARATTRPTDGRRRRAPQ
jgi:hypothetical protein